MELFPRVAAIEQKELVEISNSFRARHTLISEYERHSERKVGIRELLGNCLEFDLSCQNGVEGLRWEAAMDVDLKGLHI